MMLTLFFKQLFIAVSPQFAAFAVGGSIAYPGVLLQQVNSNSSSIHFDMDTGSWIGSINGLTGIPAILMPIIMQRRGRRFAFLAACFISIVGWLLAFTAKSATDILISESFHGLGSNSLLTVSLLNLSELVAPKFRTISMVAYFLVQSLGISATGIAAQHFHWKTISIVMGSSMLVAFMCALVWPQSPFWLAYRGEFEKCKQAFVWLRGTDYDSNKELEELITAQRENRANITLETYSIRTTLRTLASKDFYLSSLFIFILQCLMYWSGTAVVTIYGTEIIFKATESKALAAYGFMMINIALFTGISTANVLLKYFNNKSVLLFSTSGTILFLLSLSIVTWLPGLGSLLKSSFVYLLIGYMFCNSLGINTVVFTIAAELMPVKHRGIGGGLFIIFSGLLHTSSLKLAPYMFLHLGLFGTFLVYTCNVIVCGFLIWKYIPETKGRTLQEIEDYYCNLKFVKRTKSCVNEPILSSVNTE